MIIVISAAAADGVLLGDGEAGRDRVAAAARSHDCRQVLVPGDGHRGRVDAGDPLRSLADRQGRRRQRTGRPGRPVRGTVRITLHYKTVYSGRPPK